MTMAATRPATIDPWISIPRPNPQARLRLFCFPYAGGGAAPYYPWAKSLSPFIELYAVRLPGRESRLREAPHIRLASLVDSLASALAPYFDRPFAFFGHSMGALIAFELTRMLHREQDIQPLHLFASAHRAPHLPDREPPLYQLPDAEFVEEIRERYNGIPPSILENADLIRRLTPIPI
jgi:medium-chain acyl-[acyl-carrier-protein] hydrolase